MAQTRTSQALPDFKALLSVKEVRRNFGENDFARGLAYKTSGQVLVWKSSPDGRKITGKVRGTARTPYDVTASLTQGGDGRLIVESTCTCSVGYLCKHGAAVLLASLSDSVGSLPAVASNKQANMANLSTAVSSWLTALSDAVGENEDKTQPILDPLRARKRIIYILHLPGREIFATDIQARVVNIRRDGSDGIATPQNFSTMIGTYPKPFINDEDQEISRLILGGSNSYSNSSTHTLPVMATTFNVLIELLLKTRRLFLNEVGAQPLVRGQKRFGRLGWKVRDNLDGVQQPKIDIDGIDEQDVVFIKGGGLWYIDVTSGETGPVDLRDVPLNVVLQFLNGPPVSGVALDQVREIVSGRTKLASYIPPPDSVKVVEEAVQPPVPVLNIHQLQSSRQVVDTRPHPIMTLDFDYGGKRVEDSSAGEVIIRSDANGLRKTPRDMSSEREFLHILATISGIGKTLTVDPKSTSARLRAGWTFNEHPRPFERWLDFLYTDVPRLRKQGWIVEISDGIADTLRVVDADESEIDAELGDGNRGAWWFSLDLGIMVEGQRVPLMPLLLQVVRRLDNPSDPTSLERLSMQGKLFVATDDGRILRLSVDRVRPIIETLIEIFDGNLDNIKDDKIEVPLDIAAAIARLEESARVRWLNDSRSRAIIERLTGFNGLEKVAVPKSLRAELRPYQQEGLNWLQFLSNHDLAGILADDMGLGKTIQTIAHLLVEKEAGRLDKPCLIVCPTSLIPNWTTEIEKFAPSLSLLILHGKERGQNFDRITGHDIVLSTYALLPRDAEILQQTEWHMVILDEAQAIKNPASKATQTVCALNARHRLCLTGTPVENHLGEAWSQFTFLIPGLLGTNKKFTALYRTPIEKFNDTARRVALAQRLKPFILRRTKSEVAKDLPPRTEIIHGVEMGGEQRDFYETLRLSMNNKVQEAVSAKGLDRSRIVILDALLKLRQACCDPKLVKLAAANKVKESAKLESLLDLLPAMLEEGRRVLLFSQFTSMLDIIKAELKRLKIDFVELTGSTTDRATPVRRFQNEEVQLFLISLKAGGTGLNLTAADTVIHYDPWWNPAAENQASDRAHRIGQDKPVFVYKMIVRGTVEERILEMQNRKRAIAEAILSEDGGAAASLTQQDLSFLFGDSAADG